MQFLKQSTAVTVKIGPFIDDTDGKTAETALTITQADVRLSKNGGDMAQKNDASDLSHDELGVYNCSLDATDTNTAGRLQLFVHKSGALPVWHEYMVLPANVYDSLFGSDKLEVDVVQIGGATQSATDLKDFADEGYDPSTHKIEACKSNDDMRGTDNAALASVCTEARLAELDSVNMPSDLDAVKAKTDKLQFTIDNDVKATLDGEKVSLSDTTEAQIDAIEADTNEIQSKLPDENIMGSSVKTSKDDEIDAIKAKTDNLKDSWNDLSAAEVNAEVDAALADIKLDHLVAVAESNEPVDNSIIAKLASKDGVWSSFDKSTDSLEAIRDRGDDAWVTGSGGALTVEEIADAVLDEPLSEHIASGSVGEKIYGIRARVPLSPWTKKDLDKLFSILDKILKSFDSLPTIQKFQQFSDLIHSLSSQLRKDITALQSTLDRHSESSKKLLKSSSDSQSSLQKLSQDVHSLSQELSSFSGSLDSTLMKLTQSSDSIRSALSKSLSTAQEQHSRSLETLQSNLNQLSQNFPAIIQRLEEVQNNLNSVIKNESATAQDVKRTLQQLSAVLHEIEQTPFEKFLPFLKAVLISNLPTETIVSLLAEDIQPQKEVSALLRSVDEVQELDNQQASAPPEPEQREEEEKNPDKSEEENSSDG